MKIIVYIRPSEHGESMTMRVDAKYESYDTPMIQRYGNKLLNALERKSRNDEDGQSD